MSKARQLADLGNQVDDGAITGSNMVVNGGMTVAQRGVSATGLTSSQYNSLDRYRIGVGNAGTWTMSQDPDAPKGFGKSLKLSCTTADTDLGAIGYLQIEHKIEGQDLQHLNKGSSDAQKLTLSFWCKSNKTGDFRVNLFDLDNARIDGGLVSISTSATWEYKTITYDADTTGSFDNDNNGSLRIEIWLDAGTNYNTGSMPATWQASSNPDRAAGVTLALADSTSNYFQITGVCLNVGDSAIDFPHESYGETLAKCQRYFESIETSYKNSSSGYFTNHGNGAWVGPQFNFKVTKRATPSIISDLATFSWRRASFRNSSATTIGTGASTTQGITTDSFVVSIAESGISNGTTALLFSNAGYFYTADAEL